MATKERKLGDHVQISDGDYRPFVSGSDLVRNPKFKKAVSYAKNNRKRLIENTKSQR